MLMFSSICATVGIQICFLLYVRGDDTSSNDLKDCWWTGCQKNDWAVTGCAQYNRIENNRTKCQDGLLFECCDTCKWTGCEKNDWASKGCEHLAMSESKRESCDGGNKYFCCPKSEMEKKACWWTSCQSNDWLITGCKQYERIESGKERCDGGNKYYCCPSEQVPAEVPVKPDNNGIGNLTCLWSPCLEKNVTSAVCPTDAKEIGRESCDSTSEMVHCCFKSQTIIPEENNIEASSGESFTDFVKYLLFRGRNFTIAPDRLPCTMMDPNKLAILKIKNEGLRICDLCPNFPQKRLTNVFIDTLPMRTHHNLLFGECFEMCFSESNCMALSFDHDEGLCFLFDSTIGTLKEDSGWTTVFMSQPTGVLNEWSYIRHTSVMGQPIDVTNQPDFLRCLQRCQSLNTCNIVSFFILQNNCSLFDTIESINYIDLNYGHLAGFNIQSFPLGKDNLWRFTEDGNILEATKIIDTKDECVRKNFNGTHSAYYSKVCLTNEISGCDSKTGCKFCYYPEKVDQELDVPICPDSDSIRKNNIRQKLEREMTICLSNDNCIGIGYDKGKQSYLQLQLSTYMNQYDTMYTLIYPKLKTGLHKYLNQVEILPNMKISKIKGAPSNYKEIENLSYEECLKYLQKDQTYNKASYSQSLKRCHLGDTGIQFDSEKTNSYITFLEKPSLGSHLKNFVRVPNAKVEKSIAVSQYDECQQNCEELCAAKCDKSCAYVLLEFNSDKTKCFFFEGDEKDEDLKLDLAKNTMALVKISNLDFSLKSLNALSPFQGRHIFECFSEETQQTQTSLTTYETSTAVSTQRRKRGFFDAIGKAFKAVGNFIVDTVKDTVNTVVDTAKGAVDSVGKVLKGDFEGAKKSFLDIPVVKDVKTAVDLGGAVLTGDWDKAKEKGIDLLQSSTLDLAVSAIPGGKILGTAAKAAGKGLKTATKATKKATNKVKRSLDKGIDKVEAKNKKVKSDKHMKDTNKIEERGTCEKRTKRAPKSKKSKKTPGKCDKNDEDDTKFCNKPRFTHILPESVTECVKKKAGQKCDYECLPGYQEADPIITCKKVNDKHVWPANEAKCDLKDCGTGPYPLISLETPQARSLYQPNFGKYITAYVLLFEKAKKLPLWSIAMHQANLDGNAQTISQFHSKSYNSIKGSDRNPSFLKYPCRQLSTNQANDDDYLNTGWDRGHLTPANVARWSHKAKKIVNLFINIAPQDHLTNIGPWKRLEAHVECFSNKHPSLVATGVCLNGVKKKTKPGGILVPDCFWKMICYKDEMGQEQVVGFISSNRKLAQDDIEKEVYTPVSQEDVKKVMTDGSLPLIKDPWTMTATSLYKGREVAVLNPTNFQNQAVWFPVSVFKCSQANKLSDEEKKAWADALKPTKKRKRGPSSGGGGGKKRKKGQNSGKGNKKTRTKRQEPNAGGLMRGCHSSEALEETLSLLGFYNSKDDDDDEDENGCEEDEDENGCEEDEVGDGISLVDNVAQCNKRIVGYYTSWGKKRIYASHLKRLTHVIYAFIEMKADGTVAVGSADRATSEDPEKDKRITLERLEGLMTMASGFPHLKVLFAVGGWANSQYFSGMASSPEKRITFIASIIKLIEEYGFDGVDIDWEYPVTGGANEGIPEDKANYVTLMRELRTALDNFASQVNRADKFLISFASAAGQWTLDPGYDLPGLLKYADFANVMTYDFFGAWESKWGAYTGPPAPLFFGMPPRFSGKTNTDWTMKYYACKTKTPHKINMGVPFYGRYWKNVGDPVDKSDGMWRLASAVNGKFEGGYVPYNEIESEYLSNGFEKHFHKKAKAPYAWSASTKTFLGYEDEESLSQKVDYAVDKNIGGLMIWALELDDDDLTLLKTVADAPLCQKTDPNLVNFKCSPIDEKRWWTSEDGDDKAGLCGRSAPLYKGYYPVCDPDDPGYSCCGAYGYCGTGDTYCKCPTCTDFENEPDKIVKAPVKPTVSVQWYFLNDPDGKRGRCGKGAPKLNGEYPICNPDDDNAHCCSNGGYCGSTLDHCECKECVNFRKNPNYKFKD